jgi:hypothetical protein
MNNSFRIEIDEIADCMYQNLEQQSYEWIQEHLMDINNYLISVIQTEQAKQQDTTMLELQAVSILRNLIDSSTKHHILALADCLRYEVCTFGQ